VLLMLEMNLIDDSIALETSQIYHHFALDFGCFRHV
jgi:hypothetical protein